MRNIVLTGLSGSGKTTLGAMAAQELGLLFVDLDRMIEGWTGVSIKEIFEKYGEEFFRDLEARAVREASAQKGAVIATGGGVVLRRENIQVLRENGLIIFLDRPVELIMRDIMCETRPLLANGAEKLEVLSKERRSLYLKSADITLRNTAGIPEALAGLIAAVQGEITADGYAVIGDPIVHTLSPLIHQAVFASLNVKAPYRVLHVPRGKLGDFAARIRASGMKGFNVTIPHKQDIIPFLDEIDDEARLCGAVNTVVVKGRRLYGYNTDMRGLLASLRSGGYEFRNRKIVILGTGGAAGGAAFKAIQEGAREIVILGRNVEKANRIKDRISSAGPALISTGEMKTSSIAEALREADLLINATPLGMSGAEEDFTSLGFLKALPARALVYDLVYNPPQTNLLKEASALGLSTQNGLGMLIYQALLADELFLERGLDTAALFKTVRQVLAVK